MALTKEDIEKIAALIKVDAKEFADAISATEEKKVTIPELLSFTPDEITQRDNNKLIEGKKEGQKAGETIGKELAVKELKKEFGVEFDGKDLAKLTETVKTQLAKGDEGLKDQVKVLQKALTEKDAAIEQANKSAQQAVFDAQLLSAFPSNRRGLEDGGLSDQEYLAAVKANLAFEQTESGIIVKKGGEILRDGKTTNPIPVADAVKGYFTERKWDGSVSAGPGRGGSDGIPGGKPTKMSELIASWEKQGKNVASADFNTEVKALTTENPDFDLKG